MSQIITPFHIPAGAAGVMGTARIRPQQGLTKGDIKLVVITGGPVFLFEDDISGQAAFDRTHGVNNKEVDFDLASSATSTSESKREAFPNMMTVASDNDTIGYVQFKENC